MIFAEKKRITMQAIIEKACASTITLFSYSFTFIHMNKSEIRKNWNEVTKVW